MSRAATVSSYADLADAALAGGDYAGAAGYLRRMQALLVGGPIEIEKDGERIRYDYKGIQQAIDDAVAADAAATATATGGMSVSKVAWKPVSGGT